MATFNDLTLVINDITEQALGKKIITNTDITDVASVGAHVINSLDTKSLDVVFKELIDRIGLTIIDNREYKSKFDYLFKGGFEYGCILQKIHVDNFEAKTSNVYDLTDGEVDTELYKIMLPSVHQTLFENENPWEFGVTISDKQIKTAFTNAETLTAFINGIYIAMGSSVEKYLEEAGRTVIERFIAEKFNAEADEEIDGIHAVNLPQLYYDETGEEVTASDFMYNADFLRWCTSLFLDYKNLFAEMTVLFNTAGYERFTRDSELIFAIIGKFSDNIERYMTADVYNKSFVNTPAYKKVAYWQGLGKTATLTDRMTVNVKVRNPKYTAGGEEPEFLTTNKLVVGIMHDSEAIGMTLRERDTVMIPNEHKHSRNLFEQGLIGNYVDTTENGVVFYIGEVTE